ncbi:NAD-P-binding protein [Stereum hirsutum FP-91666 SS1]|uniref:NAD-P-binding protein n=1 Tax=Stereum hirsutum (strain FP-91666) TaxID=721885 RepID=R7RWG4_STEHR|nr:NAD-P-binding protein [Stereum hirsutum FP-91666 SS1]EIM79649.1 NAD-P-binding protein [Stereum hirsutum FP-91666 SS1]
MPHRCRNYDPMAEGRVGVLSEVFPPKSHWTGEDVPDLSGQTIIVTGTVLLSRNARVYMAARSEAKATAAIEELKASTKKDNFHWLKLDLGNLTSVRRAAEEFMEKECELHVLFNNGGIMEPGNEDVTAQRYDAQFGDLSFFTTLLLSVLVRTAVSESAALSGHRVRIVNTSSSHDAMAPSAGVVWSSIQKDKEAPWPSRKKMGMTQLYGQSKLCQVLLSNEIARRYCDKGIVSTSLHPGLIKTELQRNFNPVGTSITKALFSDVTYGAITQLLAGTAPEALEMNGEYLTAYARRSMASKKTMDAELAKKVWEFCEKGVAGS